MRDALIERKQANSTPWYVLMTLHGEFDDSFGDRKKQIRNRQTWNAWVWRSLDDEQKDRVRSEWKETVLGSFPSFEKSDDIEWAFNKEYQARNEGASCEMPDPSSEIRLNNVEFSRPLRVKGFIFPEGFFSSNTLYKEFSAQGAIFLGEYEAWHNTIEGGALFHSACFCRRYRSDTVEHLGEANFRYAVFKGEMESVFDDYFSEAIFTDVKFEGRVDFLSSCFHQTSQNVEYDFLFQRCEFYQPANFLDVQFRNFYPDFHGVILHENTVFTTRKENWPNITGQSPEVVKKSCATIRHFLAKQGLPEDEHFFFRREMHFAGKIGSIWQRLPYLLFGLFSEYGYSILRPTLWLLGVWALGFAAFWGYLSGCCVPAPDTVIERPMGSAMALSFSNLFPLFGFGRVYFGAEFMMNLPAVLKTLSGLQTVASLPLLFFLGLGLRQRFRLR